MGITATYRGLGTSVFSSGGCSSFTKDSKLYTRDKARGWQCYGSAAKSGLLFQRSQIPSLAPTTHLWSQGIYHPLLAFEGTAYTWCTNILAGKTPKDTKE